MGLSQAPMEPGSRPPGPVSRRPARRSLLPWTLLSALLWAGTGYAESPAAKLQALKVAYTYNIAKYVSWKDRPQTIHICVNATAPIRALLFELHQRALPGNAVLQVITEPQQTSSCHIRFVTASEDIAKGQPIRVGFGASDGYNTLIITDLPRTQHRGADLYFFLEDNKLRFEVDHERLSQKRLQISSKLLRLARQR